MPHTMPKVLKRDLSETDSVVSSVDNDVSLEQLQKERKLRESTAMEEASSEEVAGDAESQLDIGILVGHAVEAAMPNACAAVSP